MTKIVSDKQYRCTANDFIFARSFIFLFLSKNHLSVTSDVIICTRYTIFANPLNLGVYIFRNNSKNKCLVKIKVLAVCLLE